MATTTAAVPQTPQSMGAFARIFGVLFNPRPTFEDIARKPGWLAPLLTIMVFSIALGAIMGQRVDWTAVAQRQIEKSHFAAAQIAKLPADQQQAALNRQAIAGKIGVYAAGVVFPVLLALILGAIFMGLFNISGAGVSFFQSFSLISYALLPLAVKALLGIPVVAMKDPAAIDPQNYIASNLGALMPSDAALWKVGLATSIDVFVLWSVVLAAVAYSAANPKKISFGKALGITFGVFAGFTLLFTAIGAAFS